MNMTDADMHALRVAPEHRKEEVALIRSRWWDYRMQHPTVTTYHFADVYLGAHREWWRRFIDESKSADRVLWLTGDIFREKDLTAVWLARQAADRHGMPYEFVCEFALKRSLAREFRHLMRPNQLYGEEFEMDLLTLWTDHQQTQMPMPQAPFFMTSWYSGHSVQKEFRQWLVGRVNSRSKPRYRMLARLMNLDLVDQAMLVENWPAEAVQATSYQRLLSEPEGAVSHP
jgi:hypothetical protein